MKAEELNKKVQMLCDIEEIRKLKFDYWWYLDHKQWDKFADLFTEDMTYTNIASGEKKTKGPWLQGLYGFLDDNTRSSHHGHQAKIEIIDECNAKGIWVLRDELNNLRSNTVFLGRGWYFETYRKVDGVWKFSSFALDYNMARGGAVNIYGADVRSALGSIGWDLGKQSWDEALKTHMDALAELGFTF